MASGTNTNSRANQGGPQVCVIGGGIAGLVTAKVLQQDGFAVTVFEKEPTIGGVWAPSRTYPGLRANNPRETYAFSDFPYPPTVDDFPTAEQIRSYLESYVDHFGLRSRLRLATEIISVSYAPHDAAAHARFQVVTQLLENGQYPARSTSTTLSSAMGCSPRRTFRTLRVETASLALCSTQVSLPSRNSCAASELLSLVPVSRP